jgi:hypothetical protein
MRAKEHVTNAHSSFSEASTGTQNTDMRRAVAGSKSAGTDLRQLARLLTEAIQDLADYGEVIAPGSGFGVGPNEDAMPSGQRILRESDEAEATFGTFTKKTMESSDEIKEKTKSVADFVEKLGGRNRGGTASATSTPAAAPTIAMPTAGDHTENYRPWSYRHGSRQENTRQVQELEAQASWTTAELTTSTSFDNSFVGIMKRTGNAVANLMRKGGRDSASSSGQCSLKPCGGGSMEVTWLAT